MKLFQKVIVSFLLGFICSIIVASISDFDFRDVFWGSWLLFSLLFFLIVYLYYWFGAEKFLGLTIVFALLFRLGLGLITTYNLIDWGYQNDPYESGYLFKDAFTRDNQAWDLAASEKPIWAAFSNDFFSDQYGGLLALSSLVYRIFTPNAHVQFNIIFLVSIINIVGILFLSKGLLILNKEETLSGKSKLILLIFSFYPDAILFSSSQMREPLLLGLSAILFWIVQNQNFKLFLRFGLFAIISIFLLFVSLKIGLFIIFSFFIWMLFQPYVSEIRYLQPKYLIPVIVIIVLIAFYFSFSWIVEAAKWDALLLERNSGFVQYIVSIIGTRYRLAFATLYGLFQPVLPAALIEPSKLFWRILNSLRALGWYLLMPGLIYGFIYYLREKEKNKKTLFFILWLISIFWIILSSIRAGGDMWDNPRYRMSFLLLISFVVVEAFLNGWKKKDHWLIRIIIGEIVFVLFFLQWYIARYWGIFDNLPILHMMVVLAAIFILILASGLIHEHKKKKSELKLSN